MLLCISHIFRTAIAYFEVLLCYSTVLFEQPLADDITAIAWHPSSRYLATAGGGDRQIRVWHNAAGIRVQIEDLQGRIFRSRNENVKVRTPSYESGGIVVWDCAMAVLHYNSQSAIAICWLNIIYWSVRVVNNIN